MKKLVTVLLVFLLAASLTVPAFADDAAEAADMSEGENAVLPIDENVPDDILEFVAEIADDYIRSMRALEPSVPSGEFTYGGGYRRLLFGAPKKDVDEITSILDIEDDVPGEVAYIFVGYVDGEPAVVFEARRSDEGRYSTGTSILSASAARAFENAGFAMLECAGEKYVSYFGTTTECMLYAIDGSTEIMTIRSDPETPLSEDAAFSGSANETPVYFETVDFAKHMATITLEARAANEKYIQDHGYDEDAIIVGGVDTDFSGFVPTHIVDVSELNSGADGSPAVLYVAAAAVVVTVVCGAMALKVRRGRAQA